MGYGEEGSALVSSQGSTGRYIVGPLNVADCEEMVVSNHYGMSAGSWANSSYMKCYYSTNGTDYTEITNSSSTTPSGAVANHSNYAEAVFSLPAQASCSTLYLKFEFYCYQVNKNDTQIGQAYFDEVDLFGKK